MNEFAAKIELIDKIDSAAALEELRIDLLGKKGTMTEALKSVASLPIEERKTKGAELNLIKNQLQQAIDERAKELLLAEENARLAGEYYDISLAAQPHYIGKKHPISQTIDELRNIFAQMGFEWRTGPLIESEENNFDALNIPAHHPARQMHDTFYLKDEAGYVLRTHSSPVQIRTMKSEKPPIRIITAGATFRSDSDQTHTPMFHQMEALYIDKGVNMAHLKWCVTQFLQSFFEIDNIKVRFRPSFFPFTEPSAEIDIGCKRDAHKIEIGSGDDWLEIMGCGMVHPNVLANCGIDAGEYSGFALGVGIERLAMLKYNIPDLRTFFASDKGWLNHYGF